MRSAESQNIRDALCEEGVRLEWPKVHPLIFYTRSVVVNCCRRTDCLQEFTITVFGKIYLL